MVRIVNKQNIRKMSDPFKMDYMRTTVARANKLKTLKKTYTPNYPEIPGENTSTLWNKLNSNFIYDSMSKDRTETVASWIPKDFVKVFNIGFGSGNLEKVYFSQNSGSFEWHGIDIAPKSVKELVKLFPNAKFSVGDILKLKKYKNNFFDYITILEVMEHVLPRHTLHVFKETHRILKDQGHIIISVPLNEKLEEMVKRGENPNAHVRVYTPELIKAELKISGFEVLKEKQLYAFSKHYVLKTFLARYILKSYLPNNIIILARKV